MGSGRGPTLSAEGSAEVTAESSRRRGVVHNIAAVGTYGFIKEDNGDRWFFQKGDMEDQDDWGRLVAGVSVGFALGTNYQGTCAVRVKVLS